PHGPSFRKPGVKVSQERLKPITGCRRQSNLLDVFANGWRAEARLKAGPECQLLVIELHRFRATRPSTLLRIWELQSPGRSDPEVERTLDQCQQLLRIQGCAALRTRTAWRELPLGPVPLLKSGRK